MITSPRLSLDDDWHCAYRSSENAPVEPADIVVTRLRDWTLQERMPGWYLVCERTFDLTPLDMCVRYLLHIEDVPGPIEVFLGGRRVGDGAQGKLVLDVTDHVSLDDNRLRLRLDLSTLPPGTQMGSVWLQPVPCSPDV